MKQKMKQLITKLMALCMALLMTVSTCGTMVFADNAFTANSTAKITLTGLEEGVVVKAYQIIDVPVSTSGQPQTPEWVSDMATWLRHDTTKTFHNYVKVTTNTVTDTYYDVAEANMKTFAHDLAYALLCDTADTTIYNKLTVANGSGNGQTVAAGQTQLDIEGLTAGQYLIIASGGKKVYTPTIVSLMPSLKSETTTDEYELKDVITLMKGSTPGIEKTVNDKTVKIGDTVTYTLKVTVPDYPTDLSTTARKMIVQDTLSDGLTLVQTTSAENSTIYDAITVSTDAAGSNKIANTVTEGAGSAFKIETTTKENTDTVNGFKITFTDEYLKQSTVGNTTIYVIYKATVNTNAASTNDNLSNSAKLTYNNNPYTDSGYDKEEGDTEYIYTYGIDATKYSTTGTKLSGAKFKLTKDGDNAAAIHFTSQNVEENGTTKTHYYYETTQEAGNGVTTELEVNSDGMLHIRGLETGSYRLYETTAPAGYALPSGYIVIRINDGTTDVAADGNIDSETDQVMGYGGASLYSSATVNSSRVSGNIVSLSISNKSSDDAFDLPQTGGIGTTIFTVGGIVLMAGAVAYIIISKKKKSAE